jgi:uncharacterized membrane protein
MKITRRQIVSLTLGILLVGDILLAIALAFIRTWNGAAIASVSAIVTSVLFFAHLRGWKHAAVVLMIFSSVMVGSALNIVLMNGRIHTAAAHFPAGAGAGIG